MNPANDSNSNNQTPTQDSTKPQVPQLQNETPMDITIYPSNENPEVSIEPQKLDSQPLISQDSKPEITSLVSPVNSIASEIPNAPSQNENTVTIASEPNPVGSINFDTSPESEIKATPKPNPDFGTNNLLNQDKNIESSFNPITQIKSEEVNVSAQQSESSINNPVTPDTPFTPVIPEPVTPEPITSATPEVNPVVTPASNPIPGPTTENFLQNPTNQKIAMIGGIILGLVLVAGVYLFLFSGSKNVLITKKEAANNTNQPAPVLTNLTSNPPVVKQEIPVMLLNDYQNKIVAVYTKYQSLITNNQLNMVGSELNIQTLKFLGDEIFALQNEVSQYNLAPDVKVYNNKVLAELNVLVANYDDLLKAYKLSGKLTPEMKARFLTNTKNSSENFKNLILEIQNLKETKQVN